MLSKSRYRRWHQRRLSLWCGPDQAESKSGQHEETFSLCKASGEHYNLKCPWPEAERAEELKKNWITWCKASSSHHIGPGSSCSVGGRARSANQPSAAERGPQGGVMEVQQEAPHPASHTRLSGTRPLPVTYAPAGMWLKQKALLPYMVCSAIALIHHPPSPALHKLSRADVQLLSSNFAWLKKKSLIARFTTWFFSPYCNIIIAIIKTLQNIHQHAKIRSGTEQGYRLCLLEAFASSVAIGGGRAGKVWYCTKS